MTDGMERLAVHNKNKKSEEEEAGKTLLFVCDLAEGGRVC